MDERAYLLDTNIVAALARVKAGSKDPKYEGIKKKFKTALIDATIFICPITIGEIEYGTRVALIAPHEKRHYHDLARQLCQAFVCLQIDKESGASECYGELRSRLFNYCAPRERKNNAKRVEELIDPASCKQLQIQENDLWLAAVAMAYNLILVTNDRMTPIKNIADSDVQFEDWLDSADNGTNMK